MSTYTAVEQTQAAATVEVRADQHMLPLTLSAGNLGAADSVSIEQVRDGVFGPTAYVLTDTAPDISIRSPGRWVMNKGATTNAVSLHVDGNIGELDIIVG